MNLVDPSIDQVKVKELANLALRALGEQQPLDVIHALSLALASASYSAGVTEFHDVLENLRGMFTSIKAARGDRGGQSAIRVVSPDVFKRIAARVGADRFFR